MFATASASHARVIPHIFGTAIQLATTMHLLVVLPDLPRALQPYPTLREYDMSEAALRTELALEPICHTDGVMAVPQSPGLSIEDNREVLTRYN
jgi:D-galactarolactone cycloisomerase